MALTRRQVLLAGAASGAVLLARPSPTLAAFLGSNPATAAARTSKLGAGLRLLHADLHNHSLLSDGDGQAAAAFASMRSYGVDVAALTDHAGVGKVQGSSCQGCAQAVGIDESEWQLMRELADAADDPGSFTAIRGFEWSSPTLGHMNVWFSEDWTDPLVCGAIEPGTTVAFLQHQEQNPMPEEVEAEINELLRTSPTGPAGMAGFYEWLNREPSTPALGGGLDGIAGFNHPGREGGRFGFFGLDEAIRERVVSIEMFNRGEDYLFEQVDTSPSPLVECLDNGWRVGITGVTDEHGTEWGKDGSKGRTGLWVGEFSRAGVRSALLSRRFFATRESGLRLDATAGGVPMGGVVGHGSGPLTFEIDLAKGTDWVGRPLLLQVLQSGRPLPTIVHQVPITVPADDAPPVSVTVPVSREDGDWVVLRITDPSRPADGRAAPFADYQAAGSAVAYASPFFLSADPAPVVPEVGAPALALGVAALGVAGAVALRRRSHDADHHHDHPHAQPAT